MPNARGGLSWRRFHWLPRVGPRRTAAGDAGIQAAVENGTRDREEAAGHPQAHPIDRVVEVGPSVWLLLALFGYIIVLTGMTDLPLRQIPWFGAKAPTLAEPSPHSPVVTHFAGTRPAPGRDSLAVAHQNHRRRLDRLRAGQAARIAPVGLDRSFDLRADLMDMANSVRWHRGPASDLPPGSD